MGFFPAIGSKAAHFVSDLTTIILNPISEDERPASSPLPDPDVEEVRTEIMPVNDFERDSEIPDGPDTSSFRAFIVSLLSPGGSDSHSVEDFPEQNDDLGYPTLSPLGKGAKVRKGGLLSKGKQTLGRIINKATRLGGFRQGAESRVETEIVDHEAVIGTNKFSVNDSVVDDSYSELPPMSEPSMLLSELLRTALQASLPVIVHDRNWVLLYSTWRHGISLSTLYRRSALWPGESLLVVGDQSGAVFGGLVEAPLQVTSRKKYQGSISCFVFTDLPGYPVIYRPTGVNRYFTHCHPDYLALGGGGHFALYLDGELLTGSSHKSDTFDNPCLAHSQDFKVKHVELWGFVYPSRFDEVVTLSRTEKPGIWRL